MTSQLNSYVLTHQFGGNLAPGSSVIVIGTNISKEILNTVPPALCFPAQILIGYTVKNMGAD